MKYRFVDHTADVAFEVYGKDLAELIENASYAFYEAFIYLDRLSKDLEKELEIEAEEPDYMLYKWLNELLFLFDTEFFAAKEVEVKIKDNKAIGKLIGGKFNPDMVKVEPKAITMHKFKVEKNDIWKAFIVIDI